MITWILLHPVWSLLIAFGVTAVVWFGMAIYLCLTEQLDLDGYQHRSWRDRYQPDEYDGSK